MERIRSFFLSLVYRRTVALGDLGPVVSFTFDDFPRSALTAGSQIIERFGARATYYVAMGLLDLQNGLGEQFHSADLRYLADRGHEIAIHGFSHLSAREVSLDTFAKDVVRCERAIHQYLQAGASKNFAYPYGQITLRAKRRLGPQMSSSRGVVGGLNGPGVDFNLLRANSLYGDVDQLERVRKLVMKNQARKCWLIFYSHDVAEKPSPYGCTPALLEETVSFVANEGMKIMTVAEVATRLCSPV